MSSFLSPMLALAVVLRPSASCPDGYVECASEGGTCAFDGTTSIAYGQSSTFVFQTASGPSIGCNNGVFGDPLPGVGKKCCYESDSNRGELFAGPSNMDQASAETYCQENGGHLASIHSQAELDAAQAACSASGASFACWVGLQSTDGHASWSWTDGSPLDFGFNSDGAPTTGVNPWRSGEPNDYNGANEDCVEIYANLAVYGTGYNDAPCTGRSLIPLCRQQSSTSGTYFKGPNAVTYASAETYCQNNGGHLASINSQQELDAATAICSASPYCWIGLQSTGNSMGWSWMDGSPLAFGFNIDGLPTTGVNPWSPSEPNDNNGQEDCVQIGSNKLFNDLPCSHSLQPLCEK